MSSLDKLQDYAKNWSVTLTDQMIEEFKAYMELLLEWNRNINLTAITAPLEIEIKHFLDSVLLLSLVDIPSGASVIDVGTGAGFPGIPIKIARPDVCLTLLDSLRKRIGFLDTVSQALGQENACLHGRAEQSAYMPELREKFDYATARAVAALPALCEYCMPYVKVGGRFLAMKGPGAEMELEAAKPAIRLLGGEIGDMKAYQLPDGSNRVLVVINKISQCPPKYPRKAVKITKTPL